MAGHRRWIMHVDMDAFYASAAAMIEENYMGDEAYAATIEDVNATFGY